MIFDPEFGLLGETSVQRRKRLAQFLLTLLIWKRYFLLGPMGVKMLFALRFPAGTLGQSLPASTQHQTAICIATQTPANIDKGTRRRHVVLPISGQQFSTVREQCPTPWAYQARGIPGQSPITSPRQIISRLRAASFPNLAELAFAETRHTRQGFSLTSGAIPYSLIDQRLVTANAV